jgi:hypothetical protein
MNTHITKTLIALASAVLLFAAPAAAQEAHEHGEQQEQNGTPDDLAPGATGHYGAPFTSDAAPIPLREALATCVDSGQSCKIEATVSAVCARRGCWFTLEDEGVEVSVRVRMLDYGFFVPRNTGGARAVVEGVIQAVEIPQDVAQHYADDAAAAGAEPVVIEGPQQGIEITATGVELTMPATAL